MISALPEIETGTVEEAPACLDCGSQRMDWTGSGWKCQECGQTENIEMSEPHFKPEEVAEACAVIDRATESLGPLSIGKATDLLLDNLSWLPNSFEAKRLLIAAMASREN